MVDLLNQLLTHVEDHEARRWFKHEVHVSIKAAIQGIFHLVEAAEKRIALQISSTRGALLFDGWSVNRIHYDTLFASYTTNAPGREHSKLVNRKTSYVRLLSLSPMGKVESDRGSNFRCTHTFNLYLQDVGILSSYLDE